MAFGALRSVLRPVSRNLLSSRSITNSSSSSRTIPWFPIICKNAAPAPVPELFGSWSYLFRVPASIRSIQSLTETRFPKRRPVDKPRRKRASLKPPGPYAWVKHVPGEPIPPNQPNQGSVKRRNEKKRIKQHRAFILNLYNRM